MTGEKGGDSQLQKAELNWGRGEGPGGGMQLGLSMGKPIGREKQVLVMESL